MNLELLYALTEETNLCDSIQSSHSFLDTKEFRNCLLKAVCSLNKIRCTNAIEIIIICCGADHKIVRNILGMIPEKSRELVLIDKVSSFLTAQTKADIYLSDRKYFDGSRNSRLALKALSDFMTVTHSRFLSPYQHISDALDELLKEGTLSSSGSLKPQIINAREIMSYNIQSMKIHL